MAGISLAINLLRFQTVLLNSKFISVALIWLLEELELDTEEDEKDDGEDEDDDLVIQLELLSDDEDEDEDHLIQTELLLEDDVLELIDYVLPD